MLDRVPKPPEEVGRRDGIAFARFEPEGEPLGGVLVLHGADSAKEHHYDFARVLRGAGMSAVVLDLPGHGGSEPPMDGRILEHLARAANGLPDAPLALRGSSMGGYLALVAARALGARAVVAVCPAPGEALRRGLAEGRFAFRADASFGDFLARHPLEREVAAARRLALLLLHAEGDLVVPAEHSRALAEQAAARPKRVIVVPGGHHGSVQHDPDLQVVAAMFLAKALRAARGSSGARG